MGASVSRETFMHSVLLSPVRSAHDPDHGQRKPWPLDQLTEECPWAPAVWLALSSIVPSLDPIICTCPVDLARTSGVRKRSNVVRALYALSAAGWIVIEGWPTEARQRTIASHFRVRIVRDALKRRGLDGTFAGH